MKGRFVFWHGYESNWPHILWLLIGIGIGLFFGGSGSGNPASGLAERSYTACLVKTFIPNILKPNSWQIAQWACEFKTNPIDILPPWMNK
jgi:hypothetical protein